MGWQRQRGFVAVFRLRPRRIWLIWRVYQPEPAELCSGFGLFTGAVASVLTDDVRFTPFSWTVVAVQFCVGIAMMVAAACKFPRTIRGDLAGACSLLWAYFLACVWIRYGFIPREGSQVAILLASFLSMLRDWDDT